jgi:hypothetical protein
VGGSKILDISSHLQSAKIVVYKASDGAQLAEVPIELRENPGLTMLLLEFALSPDGSQLAVLSGGFLQLTPIAAH